MSTPSTAPSRLRARWTSVFVKWHLRHSAIMTVLAHVATLIFLATVPRGPASTPIRFFGADIATFIILLSVALSTFDRRRRGGPDLMANLGYTRTSLILVSLVATIPVELLLNGMVTLLLGHR